MLRFSYACAFCALFSILSNVSYAQTAAEARLPADVVKRNIGGTRVKSTIGDSLLRMRSGKEIIYQPAFGYVWKNPNDKTDTRVRLRDGLREQSRFSIVPATGYRWVAPFDASDARVIPLGLAMNGDTAMVPDTGYVWVNGSDPKDNRVRVRDGLVVRVDGKFTPAPGYVWASADKNDLSVISTNAVSTSAAQVAPSNEPAPSTAPAPGSTRQFSWQSEKGPVRWSTEDGVTWIEEAPSGRRVWTKKERAVIKGTRGIVLTSSDPNSFIENFIPDLGEQGPMMFRIPSAGVVEWQVVPAYVRAVLQK